MRFSYQRSALALISLIVSSGASAATADIFVYTGAGCDGRSALPPFEMLIGRKTDGVLEFVDTGSWETFLSSSRWSLECWPSSYRVAMSVPMLVKNASLDSGLRGDYDKHFSKLASMLVSTGHADAYIRIGWEFNGNWYPWSAVERPQEWIRYFRRIAQIFRDTHGNKFSIIWNPTNGYQSIPADKAYPGDDVVDIIGVDLYNRFYTQNLKDPKRRWSNLVYEPYGLDWVTNFAKIHNKPLALPEWGTGNAADGSGGGDDPYFVESVASWIADNNVVFHGYWNYQAPDYQSSISNGDRPKSSEIFSKKFGIRRLKGAEVSDNSSAD